MGVWVQEELLSSRGFFSVAPGILRRKERLKIDGIGV